MVYHAIAFCILLSTTSVIQTFVCPFNRLYAHMFHVHVQDIDISLRMLNMYLTTDNTHNNMLKQCLINIQQHVHAPIYIYIYIYINMHLTYMYV